MLSVLLITAREGLEAFLIVAMMAAYLRNTGRMRLLPAIWAGVGVALLLSATTGWHVGQLAADELFEGVFALVAGVLVAGFTLYIMRTAKHFRTQLGTQLESMAVRPTPVALGGVFIFTLLMVLREGMETALMLGTLSAQMSALELWSGAALGLLLVVAMGLLWVTQSHKINLKLFLQVTGAFLVLFALHLFIYGLHELSELSLLPLVDNVTLHELTEPFGHDGPYAQILTLAMIGLPLLWLGLAALWPKRASA